jgi:bla regulator protein BlaR1
MLEELCLELGLADPPALLSSRLVTAPMTWGIRRPVVLMPVASRGWPAAQRRQVLLHELAHIKRRDCLTQFTAHVAHLIFWFNPLLGLAKRRMRAERERACDDRVLLAGARPSSYACHLLNVVARLRGRYCYVSTVLEVAHRGGLSDRLDALLDPGQWRSGPGHRFTAVAGILILGTVMTLAAIGGCSFYKGASLATSWLSPADRRQVLQALHSVPSPG